MTLVEAYKKTEVLQEEHHKHLARSIDEIANALVNEDIQEITRIVEESRTLSGDIKARAKAIMEEVR